MCTVLSFSPKSFRSNSFFRYCGVATVGLGTLSASLLYSLSPKVSGVCLGCGCSVLCGFVSCLVCLCTASSSLSSSCVALRLSVFLCPSDFRDDVESDLSLVGLGGFALFLTVYQSVVSFRVSKDDRVSSKEARL